MSRACSPDRRAMTLPELLVMLAVFGLLIAVLLPMVQKLLDTSKRMRCANNLKQIGIAIHTFHQFNRCYPTAPGGDDFLAGCGIAYDQKGTPLGVQFQTAGWAFQILPYLEQERLYQISDVHHGKDGKPDNIWSYPNSDLRKPSGPEQFPAGSYNVDLFGPPGAVRSQVVATYYCQSRHEPGVIAGLGMVDYAACRPDKVPMPLKDGPFVTDPTGSLLMSNPIGLHGVISARSEKVTFGKVRDGTSKTLMIAEKFVRPENYTTRGPGQWLGFAEYGGLDTCRSTAAVSGWLPNPSQDRNDIAQNQDVQFGAAHPAGVNVLFADAAVHLVSYGIDPQVFNAIACRDDGSNLDDQFAF